MRGDPAQDAGPGETPEEEKGEPEVGEKLRGSLLGDEDAAVTKHHPVLAAKQPGIFEPFAHRRDLRDDVVDEKCKDPGLRGDVEKLGYDRADKVPVRPDRFFCARCLVIEVVSVLCLEVGDAGKKENDSQHENNRRDPGIRDPKGLVRGLDALI